MAPEKDDPSEKDEADDGLTLLANGASGPWDVSIDSSDNETLFAHIEGPSVYLYFNIASIDIVGRTLRFLQKQPPEAFRFQGKFSPRPNGTLNVGRFGRASINLTWDDEFEDRCFLIVGVSGKKSLRFSLAGEQIKHLKSALEQVSRDLKD